MKYKLQLQYNIDIPSQSKYVLFYTKKTGETNFYPISKIIMQNGKLKAINLAGSSVVLAIR